MKRKLSKEDHINDRIDGITKTIKSLQKTQDSIKWYQDLSYTKRINISNAIIKLKEERSILRWVLRK